MDVDRITASATYHQPFRDGESIWASTAGFGRKLRGLKTTADELPEYVERLARRYLAGRSEGETFAIAQGLLMGGKKPVVCIQNTGFFESGDSIRGIWIDLKLPILYVGVGEGIDDLIPFSAQEYVDALFQEKW